MKNWILVFGLLWSYSAISQDLKVEENDDNKVILSDKVKLNTDENTVEYIGNVTFENEIIKLENADRIVFNSLSNEIIVSGLKSFSFNGKVQIKNKAENNILRYKLGEKIVFLE